MKGEVIIDMKGEISSTLPHSNEQTNELGILISNILQDINSYMRLNSGSTTTGDLRKTTLRLGNSHEVRIVVGSDRIKAVVREVEGYAGSTAANTTTTTTAINAAVNANGQHSNGRINENGNSN